MSRQFRGCLPVVDQWTLLLTHDDDDRASASCCRRASVTSLTRDGRPSGDRLQARRRCRAGSASGWWTNTLTSPSIASPSAHRPAPEAAGNILENPQAAIVFDHYDEDWRRLDWVMLRGGRDPGRRPPSTAGRRRLLQTRSSPACHHADRRPARHRHRIERVASWGDLGIDPRRQVALTAFALDGYHASAHLPAPRA